MKTKSLLTTLTLIVATLSFANSPHAQVSKYAGQETRQIKSLSPADIEELKRGGGWGLAKAAELNGMPGPAHLLELKDKIPLSAEQATAIEKIHANMKREAIKLGEMLISLELQLEQKFRTRKITDDELRTLLAAISDARNELRYIHLSTHLSTPALLSDEQIDHYNELRGYGSSDPCTNIPEGHNAAMWKKHNGCE